MTAMRKAKEEELFEEFQVHQSKMCDLLATQMAQASSDEDKRIAQAVVEQEAKKLVSHVHTLLSGSGYDCHTGAYVVSVASGNTQSEPGSNRVFPDATDAATIIL